jgi:protein TonB
MRSLIIVFLLLSISSFAQQGEKNGTIKVKKSKVTKDTASVTLVEDFGDDPAPLTILPEYPGGEEGLKKFISDRIRLPEMVKNGKVQGTCFTSIIVNEDGSLSGPTITKGIPDCKECDEEALRILKLMGRWKPGNIDGNIAAIQVDIPIEFKSKAK